MLCEGASNSASVGNFEKKGVKGLSDFECKGCAGVHGFFEDAKVRIFEKIRRV